MGTEEDIMLQPILELCQSKRQEMWTSIGFFENFFKFPKVNKLKLYGTVQRF